MISSLICPFEEMQLDRFATILVWEIGLLFGSYIICIWAKIESPGPDLDFWHPSNSFWRNKDLVELLNLSLNIQEKYRLNDFSRRANFIISIKIFINLNFTIFEFY